MLLACFQPATGVLSRRKEKDTATWRQDESRTKGKDDHQQVEEGGLPLGKGEEVNVLSQSHRWPRVL